MLFTHKEVNNDAVLIIAQAMAKVAICDGLDPREKNLISGLLDTIEGAPTFDMLAGKELDLAKAKTILDADSRTMLVEGCWLVALADRSVSAEEKAIIKGFADGLGVNNIDQIRDEVIGEFIKNFSHLKNVDAIAELTAQLKA